jgi:hypothetical protein
MTGQLRLLRIRNPWGKIEWKGNFSSHSSLWTTKLKKLLSETSSRSNASCSVDGSDGSFWITYTDFLRRFVTIDICKAYRHRIDSPLSPSLTFSSSIPSSHWMVHCVEDTIGLDDLSTTSYFLLTIDSSSSSSSHLSSPSPSLYLTLLQESKRGSYASPDPSKRAYYYSDLTAIIRRYAPSQSDHGMFIGSIFSAPMRSTAPLELCLSSGLYLIQIMRFSPVLSAPPPSRPLSSAHSRPLSSPPLKGAYLLRHNQRYWVHIYSPLPLQIQKFSHSLPPPSAPPPQHLPPSLAINLLSYLDDLCSLSPLPLPHPPHLSSQPIVSRLCSSPSSHSSDGLPQQTQTPPLDVFVLRGNGMNLLFCRRRRRSNSQHSHDMFLTSTESNEPPLAMELVTIKKTDLTILSPYILQHQPAGDTATPSQDLSRLMTTFRFRMIKEGQLKVLAVIFHTKGSDSFESIGDMYLHPSASVINSLPRSESSIALVAELTRSEFGSYWKTFDAWSPHLNHPLA